jgi:hypothetical protein
MSYVASILKAQEGNMDHTFWNETLRVSPMDFGGKNAGMGVFMSSATSMNGALQWEQAGAEVKAIRAQVAGLKVLSLAGNAFSDKSMYTIGKFLRHNQWLVGLNLAHNGISGGGIKHLANALATNTALHTLVIAGNPGYRREIGTVLDSMSQTLPNMEWRAVQMQSSSTSTCSSGATQKGGTPAGGRPADTLSGIKKGVSVRSGGTATVTAGGGPVDTLERYGGYLVRHDAMAALEDWGCNASMEDADAEKEKDRQATREALLHKGGAVPQGDKSGSATAATAAAAAAVAVAAAAYDVSEGSPTRTPRSKEPSPRTVRGATPTKIPTAVKKVATRVGDRQRQQAAKASEAGKSKANALCEADVRDMVHESLRRQLVTHLRG